MNPNNPYEQGVADAKRGICMNRYPEFSEKWALYNRGFNSIANPWMTK